MLGPYPLPLAGRSLEIPHHLLERSHLAPKKDRNPLYAIVRGGGGGQEFIEHLTDLISLSYP
jgi:hypothetical protein